MKENLLIDLSKNFAIQIIKICKVIKEERRESIIVNQLLRSGTSIGANIHEANYAASKADFINKFQIALKECYETEYWLDIMKESGVINLERYDEIDSKCRKIRKLLSSSVNTAKENGISN